MKPLPTFASRSADETLSAYGYRIVQFLMESEATASLSTDELQLAQHTIVAIYGQRPSDLLIRNLRAIERILSSVLAFRALDQDQPAAAVTVPTVQLSKPNIGPMAPLAPKPIIPTAPKTRVAINF
jgi:hypothetical protein